MVSDDPKPHRSATPRQGEVRRGDVPLGLAVFVAVFVRPWAAAGS